MNNNKKNKKIVGGSKCYTFSFKNSFFINLGNKSMFENVMMLYIWNYYSNALGWLRLSCPHQGCTYLIENTVIVWDIITIKAI